jgi:hypothetical protein
VLWKGLQLMVFQSGCLIRMTNFFKNPHMCAKNRIWLRERERKKVSMVRAPTRRLAIVWPKNLLFLLVRAINHVGKN